MNYVVDSNTFRVLGNYYPARFPSLWEQLNLLVADGRWTSVREVRKELDRQNVGDHVDSWVESNKGIFLPPTSDDLERVATILAVVHFQQLIGEKQRLRGWPVADPFVVARAMKSGASVVTEEEWKRNGAKIPNVCEYFGVECMNLEGLMAREGWTF
ncbi:MAG: PIN domain-containing protein [Gemmatimonadota bacterium]